MAPPWPFKKKKPAKPNISRSSYMKNVVEYERKSGKKESQGKDESHLKDRKFLDAMKLLSNKGDEN
tara:strand:+ start:599 stop:796 length:198 start_codon:yes stop_codon:yes gene_type:complete